MKESRAFELNQVTAEQVLEAVTTFLRGEKGMEVQSVATPNGYLIQAAQTDTLRTLSGMKLATTVELTVNGTQLNVTLGEGQWADKLGAGAVDDVCAVIGKRSAGLVCHGVYDAEQSVGERHTGQTLPSVRRSR